MAMFNFLNLTLGISVWYLDPPPTDPPPSYLIPYLTLTPMQSILTTPVAPQSPIRPSLPLQNREKN